ncbi:unnamed protein product [Paramecium sonneborni]|uniref:Uncharacterized protein n=1 Tax=Paramecium sonneborni TaxID=65129 RepID=A0A8S1MH06_9CILI|nr:unnamed protein product [Paramecium sonneborni]
MNRVIAFSFATYESLVQRLSSVDNANNLFRIYEENKEQFKHEHIVLSMKMLGKFSRQIHSDNKFLEITNKLNDIVDQLTEYDVVDVLFCLRKFRSSRVPINITNQTQNQLFQRIKQMSDKQMFSFKNMCNIYYDLSFLNHYTESLVKSISEQMLTSKQLSPFIIIQLLSTIVIKINHCIISKYDQVILTNSIKVLDTQLDSFDLEQKSFVFKLCAEVKFQNLPPKFQLPIQLKKIQDNLSDKVDQLQEESVINIFKAYECLPKQFDFYLLRNLRDIIIRTLEQNPQSLNNQFLIQIAERMIKLSHRISLDNIKRVLIEICNRIQNKTIDIKLLDQLIPVLMKYKKIEDVLNIFIKLEDKSIMVQSYLFINGINMKVYLDEYIQNKKNQQIPLNLAITYAIFANRDAKEHVDLFLEVCREQLQKYPLQTLRTLQDVQLNYQIKYQIQEEAYLNLIEQIQQNKFDFLRICKDLIHSCCNIKCRNALFQLYEQQNDQINPKQIIHRLIQQGSDSLSYESFNALAQILLKDPKNIPIQKFVDYLTLNQQQLLELIKSDHISLATKILINAYQAQPEQKLYSIVNFAIRFEIAGYHSEYISNAIKMISQLFKKNYPCSPYPDPLFVNLLINYNIMTPEDAINQLNNEKIHYNTKVQLLGIIQSSKNNPENIQELSDQIKANSFVSLQKEITYQPILDLITLGYYTYDELQNIKMNLQTLLPNLSIKQYYELIMFARHESILRELAFLFYEFSAKFGINRIIRAAHKFAKFKIRTQSVYNVLLETYGYSFNTVFNEQRIQILQIFALAKIKEPDLFKRSLEKIKQQASAYKVYYNDIIEIVTSLGLIEQEFVDLINEIIGKNQMQSQVALKLMHYYVLADQPIQDIEKIVPIINLGDIKNKDNYRSVLVYEILLRKYPNSIATQVNEIFLHEDKFSKIRYNLANPIQIQYFKYQLCQQYLQLLGVEIELNKTINGINVELYLPSIETSLLIVSQVQLNYDQTTLSGHGILEKKLLETLTKSVIVINFKQFIKIENHQDRAIFLMNLGIPINVDISQIDFSSISIDQIDERAKHLRSYNKNDTDKTDFDEDD